MNEETKLDLSPTARRKIIADQIQTRKTLEVKALARELYVNEATVRRDLNRLSAEGVVRRTYGGAVLIEGLDAEIPFSTREGVQNEKKDLICQRAAAMVRDGDTLLLDSSSTVARMVKYLTQKDLKIITNGAKTALMLARLPGVSVYCTGGRMRENSLSYVGAAAETFIRNFYADKLFFSCRSLSPRGLSDPNEEEALLRRGMLACCHQSVLLIDSTKLNSQSFFHICQADALDLILCDAPELLRQMLGQE